MTRNHETLHTAGEALFGRSWQSDLARELGIRIRTMQRWASGEFNVPEGVWTDIAKLCERRGKALAKLADQLN